MPGVKYRIIQCVWEGTKRAAGTACKDLPRPPVMKSCKGPPCTPPGVSARETWRKLRDCHRDALRRQKRRFGLPSKIWAYQREMEFLLPYMFTKALPKPSSNDNDNKQCNNQNDEPQTTTVKEEIYVNSNNIKNDKTNDNNNKSIDDEKYNENIVKEEIQLSFDDDQKDDALYQFFVSMYTSTKKLSKQMQLQIKRKLFEAVSLAEESLVENHLEPTSSSYYDVHGI